MNGLKEKFEATFKELWPEFNYKKRAVVVSPERLAQESATFLVGWPSSYTNSKTSSRKASGDSSLVSSRFNVSSQIKQIANPAKLTTSLKVPHAED